MPRPWEYGRRRRLMMQVTMWLVLAAALGLAGLVDHHKTSVMQASLDSRSMRSGSISYRLPAKWVPADDAGENPHVIASVVEPTANGQPPQRRLTIYFDLAPPGTGPRRYLKNNFLTLDIAESATLVEMAGDPVTISGAPAVRMGVRELVQTEDGQVEMREQTMLICGVLPDGQAITIAVWRAGELQPADGLLLDAVAGTIKVERSKNLLP